MRRRVLLTGAALGGIASFIPPGGPAAAARLPDQLPIGIAPDIGEVLKLVGEVKDVLLLSTMSRLDGGPTFYLDHAVAYADMPGNPLPATLPHGAELVRYTSVAVKHLWRTGDAELTATMRLLMVPVDAAGHQITEWINPVDGARRPMPPTLLRDYKFVMRVVDDRLRFGTPDLVAEAATAAETPQSTLLWSHSVIKSHNLTERLGIPEDYGFAGNVTESVSQASHIGLPGPLPSVPVTIPTVRQLVVRHPFPPEMALKPATVPGQANIRLTETRVPGIDALPAWLRDLIFTQFPDLLTSPPDLGEQWDDTRWSAFYRDQLEPQSLTWAEWCESSIIKD